jgi:Fe-S oxidoreductase
MDEISREILWNIPPFMKYGMYFSLIVAFAIFILGMQRKVAYVKGAGNLKALLPSEFNWSAFGKTIFFQGKIPRDTYVAVFHSLIFYGFLILWVATDLVAIHFDTPFKVFKGTTYVVVSFLADIAGLAILIGVGLAYYRRYILNPSYLSATKPKQEKFMYAMLVWLVGIGYLLEGLRILGTGMPVNEAWISPIGWFVASIFKSFNFSNTTLAYIYRSFWGIHMLNTMAFVASIPFTKFSHILWGPLNALLTPYRRGAVLKPMDFSNENAETFGLGKSSELTEKQRLDTLACVECGRCTQVCPANIAEKPLNPKTIITKMRDKLFENSDGGLKAPADFNLWENPIYQSNELDSCTTCGACMEECPMSIEHVSLIMDLKRYKALTLGELPPSAADAVNKIKINGNPWGIAQDDRMKWAEGIEVPVAKEGEKIDYLYYVGCAGSYDANNQKVVKDTVMLLKKAGVSFAVMGKTEKCNGDPIRRFGDEYSFFEVAIENIANMRKYSFDKVVTHCPHCLHTIGKEYAKFENGAFETVHHTELLADLVSTGKLKPTKTVSDTVTYHDPCYLGRHHGEYDAPREILNAIPGIAVKEMEKNKDKSLCCGMGGGNMWYELPEGKHLAVNRLEHIGETQAPKLATSCSFCMINFNSSKAQVAKTENIQVEDVAQILAKSVE